MSGTLLNPDLCRLEIDVIYKSSSHVHLFSLLSYLEEAGVHLSFISLDYTIKQQFATDSILQTGRCYFVG
jgi:hypothetical protein